MVDEPCFSAPGTDSDVQTLALDGTGRSKSNGPKPQQKDLELLQAAKSSGCNKSYVKHLCWAGTIATASLRELLQDRLAKRYASTGREDVPIHRYG